MRIKKLAMSGAAAVALAFLSSGAMAGESTPAEIMATNQLNDQQMAMAKGTISDNTPIGNSGKTNLEERTLSSEPGAIVSKAQTSSTAMPNETQTMAMNGSAAGAAPMAKSQPADAIAQPDKVFGSANVVASDGQTVGAVQHIAVDANGLAKSVNVAILDNSGMAKNVTLDAAALAFDPSKNVLVAAMTNDQIKALPSEPQG